MAMEKENRLCLAIVLATCFMIFELVGGYMSGSLAIVSDAVHLLTDVAGFAIALIATLASKSAASKHYTYGLARAEVLGAMVSIMTVLVLAIFLIIGAYSRIRAILESTTETETFVDGKFMFIIAVIGVLVNICLATVFMEDHGGLGHDHSHGHCEHAISHDVENSTTDHDHNSCCNGHGHDDHDDNGHDHDHGHGHGHGQKHAHEEKPTSSHDHQHAHAVENTPLITKHVDHGSTTDSSHSHAHNGHNGHEGHDHGSHHGSHENVTDVNMHAAYLHVMTDLIQSVGVAIAGLAIWINPSWQIIDPICTLLFSVLVIWYGTVIYVYMSASAPSTAYVYIL